MKIRSKFKDYYDFVGHITHNDDPRDKVWVRNSEYVQDDKLPKVGLFGDTYSRPTFQYLHFLIADERYTVAYQTDEQQHKIWCWEPKFNMKLYLARQNKDGKPNKWLTKWYIKRGITSNPNYVSYPILGKPIPVTEEVRAFQIKHKTPIIMLQGEKSDVVLNPKLAQYQFPKFLDAHVLWQNLDRWWTDGKFDAPPPEVQTDKGKIISHGFDLRQSFRHRK